MALADTREATLEDLLVRIDALERENKILREENALLKKWRFGRSSERLEPGQMKFFETGEWPAQDSDPTIPKRAPRKPKSPAKGHGRGPFPEHLDREEHLLNLPEDERACPCCSTTMQRIGEDITERGRLIPARIVVDRYVRGKYACPHGHAVKTASLPDGVIDGGKYDASVYANIATAKYNDHLPLNRLEGIYERYGIRIPKQTMWDMLKRVDELVAQPILKQMREELLQEPILHADETSVALRVEGQKVSKKGWVWGWRNEPGDRLFESPNRVSPGPGQTCASQLPRRVGRDTFGRRVFELRVHLQSEWHYPSGLLGACTPLLSRGARERCEQGCADLPHGEPFVCA